MVRRPEPDDEGPSAEDLERFGDVTQKCPNCGTEIFDDVAVCWKCGESIMATREVNPAWRIWVAVIVGLLIVAMFFFSRWP